MLRQIVLDTETTGIDPNQGHRIIEVGCLELVNRRITGNTYHVYINPDREIERGAEAVHGITTAFLRDKPRFAEIAEDFLAFVQDAELIIHNAPFDVGFINAELQRLTAKHPPIDRLCGIIDTLTLARQKHPGQRNSLDALCARYHVDNSNRSLHGALLDAELLAQVYLLLTGGQTQLFSQALEEVESATQSEMGVMRLPADRKRCPVIQPTAQEQAEHAAFWD